MTAPLVTPEQLRARLTNTSSVKQFRFRESFEPGETVSVRIDAVRESDLDHMDDFEFEGYELDGTPCQLVDEST
ncbi:MAG: hypothetical protein ABEN55_10940, partial [Bradymonadaceae bacterium]